jgi:hypothetical protein
VREIVLKTERDLPVRVRIYPAAATQRKVLVYFSLDPATETTVRRLCSAGFTVAVPEVRGSGRTKVQDMTSVRLFSMMLGKHLFAGRLYDLQRVLDYLGTEYRGNELVVWGEGAREGVMALYLAAIDARVHTAISSHGLVSYQDIVDRDGLPDFDYYVPGILQHADTAEMAAVVAPRRVIVAAPQTIDGQSASAAQVEQTYAWARNVYRTLGKEALLSVSTDADPVELLTGPRPHR